jgi:hypothetical protein
MAKKQGNKGGKSKGKSKGNRGSNSLLASVSQKLPGTVSSVGSMNTLNSNNHVVQNIARFSTTMTILMVIIFSVTLAINVGGLMWINKLEEINCACSEHWMRTYIKYYLYVLIPISFLSLAMTIYRFHISSDIHSPVFYYYGLFTFIFGIFGFINIFVVVIFVNKLKEINCVCSEDVKREVYWIYNIVLLCWAVIQVLLLLIMIPFLMSFFKTVMPSDMSSE